MELVKVTIDGKTVEVPSDFTVIEAAAKAGIRIPQLCYHPELAKEGACRVCVVEIVGGRGLGAACVYPVSDGMVVHTNTPKVRETRKAVVELLLANHPQDCLFCQKNQDCELQQTAADLGVREVPYTGEKRSAQKDESNPSLVRDPNKCILCGRCIRACHERQGLDVYGYINRGFKTIVGPAFNLGLDQVACTYCGQCAAVCPTAAICERDDTEKVFAALADPKKYTIVQTAPATRVALGEALGLPAGEVVTGKMVAALRRLGFDKVFDTDFTADLTIMEEGYDGSTSSKSNTPIFCRICQPRSLRRECSARSPRPTGPRRRTYRSKTFTASPSCPAPRRRPSASARSSRATRAYPTSTQSSRPASSRA